MSVSDHYYYIDTRGAEEGFSDTPQAAIEINRILANKKDCFILPEANAKNKLKKTIIINTWCKEHFNREGFNDHLIELLGEDFEIYQVNNGQLKRIKRINQIEKMAKAELNEDQLRKLLTSHKIEQVRTQVLGYGQCQQLLGLDSSSVSAHSLREAYLLTSEKHQLLTSGMCLTISDWQKDRGLIKEAKFIANDEVSPETMPNDVELFHKIKYFDAGNYKKLSHFYPKAINCENAQLSIGDFKNWKNPPKSLKELTINCISPDLI